MELILHPTIKTKQPISYNHIITLRDNLEIYIGNKESREKIFDYIIEICNENEDYPLLSYIPKEVLTLSFNDTRKYNILQQKDIVRDFITNCSNGKLLINCGEGISRSPSLLIMFLVSEYHYTYEQAFEIISSKRFIKPNVGFTRQLKSIS